MHPLVLIGALVIDFLAIHPVADGNGRLARLLRTSCSPKVTESHAM